jgi:hypothetical protein
MMFADDRYGACLRSLVAHLFDEAYLRADLELVEVPVHDAVAMEVNQAPVGCLELAVVHVWVELGHTAMRRHLVALDIATLTPHEIFQLPPYRVKGVSRGHVGILMSVVLTVLVVHGQLRTGHGDAHAYIEEIAKMLVLVKLLHHYVASDDMVAETLELVCPLADFGFQRWGRLHATPDDLQWLLHDGHSMND